MATPFRLGVCSWSLPQSCLKERFSVIQALGLDGIELDTDSAGLIDTGDLFSQAKAPAELVSAVALNGLGAYPVFSKEVAVREQVLGVFGQAVRFAAEHHIPVLQVPFFYDNAINGENMHDAANLLHAFCEKAAAFGLTVGVECTLNAQEHLQLLSLVNHPHFGVYYDTANPVFFGGHPSAAMLRELTAHIVQIHVKECSLQEIGKLPLGEGCGCFAACAEEIVKNGAPQWIVLENMYGDTPQEMQRMQKDIETMKHWFA